MQEKCIEKYMQRIFDLATIESEVKQQQKEEKQKQKR